MFEEQSCNWLEADKQCEEAGGILVTDIHDCILKKLTQEVRYFIGGNKSSSGIWTWIDGSPINQTHWFPGEPNNSGEKEFCLQMWLESDTVYWNDISCDSKISGGYVCQKTSVITETTSPRKSEQPTTLPTEETSVKYNGTTTSHCDDLPHHELHVDCVSNIENINGKVDSVLRGNSSKKEIELVIHNALHKLQEISINHEQTQYDMESSINLLDKILDAYIELNVSLPSTVIVTTLDNLLAENLTAAWKKTSTKQANSRVNKIFRMVDKFGLHVLQTIKENDSITYNSTKNMVFTVAKIPADQNVIFPENENILGSSLVLPVQGHGSNQNIPYLAVKYKTLGAFIKNKNRSKENAGYRISSDILSLTLNDPLLEGALDPSLHLKFLKQENFNNSISECAFWDFDHNNGDGGWSTRGCKLQSANGRYFHCECNHLTNFAVLVRPYSKTLDEEEALSWISIIGCSISVFLSLLTAIVYIVFWKSITCDVSRMVNKITVLLCLSIAMAYTIFLLGVDKIRYKVGCIVITAFLQYLFLFVFFLMLALGLYYFSSISLIKISFSKATAFQSKSSFFSKIIWGVVAVMPACITAVTFGVIFFLDKDYNSKNSCWLSFESGALYGFVGPVACIVLINIVIVIVLSVTLCSIGFSPQDKGRKKILAGIRSICTLLPVLGVTWLFGLLSINDDVVVFQYIFSLLNSFQGLFIFISKCLLSKKIRRSLSKCIHKKGSENWRSRLYSLLSNNMLSMNTKEFSSVSKIQPEGEECTSKLRKGNLIKGISFKGRESVNTSL
ncbi:adhesion G-protein coupled receptor D1-like [Saccostrea echinata]|uniref:adhesion G-protein coupled receptor D1-like n=1 Tax=Saccostrea echinata TaxID=191078 RepID=UPI002A823AB9|nr:adhesion G-protein coupled receptor D1-like [Saccostrea echinata]